MNCDFCTEPGAAWMYPTRAARPPLTDLLSEISAEPVRLGRWSACPDCHVLIEAGVAVGLLGRTLDQLELPGGPPFMRPRLAALHALFWATRAGGPLSIGDAYLDGYDEEQRHG